ncbi:equilibrative nucleoside transporter [Acrasis kona]|uniref:Equilibrative nucleoside transporter n=1 Tax=Acrasis kona TaxID=1008807 RepID=A0AAW2YM88_9EUKA
MTAQEEQEEPGAVADSNTSCLSIQNEVEEPSPKDIKDVVSSTTTDTDQGQRIHTEKEDYAPIWGYFVFYLFGVGVVMSYFTFILCLDFYRNVFIDFAYLSIVFNIGFNCGGWVTSTFFALPLQSIIRSHILMVLFFCINIFCLVVAIVLNYCCTLDTVSVIGPPNRLIMSLLCIDLCVLGISYGVCSSCLFSVVGPISPKYTSAVMAGIGSAGILVSIIRLISKAIASVVPRTLYVQMIAANCFFSIAVIIQVCCLIASACLIKMPFTIKSIPRKPRNKKELEEVDSLEQSGPVPKEPFSDKIKAWFQVVGACALPGSYVLYTFTITYCMYPGIITGYKSNMNEYFQASGFFSATTLACYSLGDFIGRLISVFRKLHIIPVKWLWTVLLWRILFIPLLIVYLRYNLTIYDPLKILAAFFFSLLGGYFGSISMMMGSGMVKGRRYAGSAMTFWLNSGVALGAIIGAPIGYACSLMNQS